MPFNAATNPKKSRSLDRDVCVSILLFKPEARGYRIVSSLAKTVDGGTREASTSQPEESGTVDRRLHHTTQNLLRGSDNIE